MISYILCLDSMNGGMKSALRDTNVLVPLTGAEMKLTPDINNNINKIWKCIYR